MEDLISQLPDTLLQQILLNLPTRRSVMTSVLSTRWRNLWQSVPALHLIDDDDYTNPDVQDFLHRFLILHEESPIYQFSFWCISLSHDDCLDHIPRLKLLIHQVVTRGVECLAVDCRWFLRFYSGRIQLLPLRFYIKMCIDICFDGKGDLSEMQILHNFFAGISNVTDLCISGNTLQGIYPYSKLQQLPEFKNLTHLYAIFRSDISEMLPIYLSSCPNLNSIDLELHGYPKMEEIASSPVPQCLQTSIEYVEIKMIPEAGQERSPRSETEFGKYILENATVLKKLTFWLEEEEDVRSSVLKQILTFRQCSFIQVKMCRVPANFRVGHEFVSKPFFDPFRTS